HELPPAGSAARRPVAVGETATFGWAPAGAVTAARPPSGVVSMRDGNDAEAEPATWPPTTRTSDPHGAPAAGSAPRSAGPPTSGRLRARPAVTGWRSAPAPCRHAGTPASGTAAAVRPPLAAAG